MFAEPGGYLHGLSSTLLLGASDYDSCRAISMIPAKTDDFSSELQGSLSRLWPLFGTLCLSHFLETISCAVQGRPVAVETGMTLFEHSLAFAEADAAISNQLGWGLFTSGSSNLTFQQSAGPSIAITRGMVMKRVNTPPEVLLVAFISAMSHVTSHTLGVLGLQSKYRLFSTGFWAMCFMASIVLETLSFSLDDPSSMGLFRFPTVCIIGFIPHLMVFGGILICAFIYAIALCLSALEPPEQGDDGRPPTFWGRLVRAHANMQANISLSDIRISRDMDFYTALLRTGFGVITMASEAVYLNEDRGVNLKESTWLEEERYRELESLRMQWAGAGLGSSYYNSVGTIGLVPVKDGQLGVSNGYSRERAAQKIPKSRLGERKARDGVGATERSSRWLLALEFIMNINRLLLRWGAMIMLKGLTRIGLRAQPRILVWLSRWPKTGDKKDEGQAAGGEKDGSRSSRIDGRQQQQGGFLNEERADIEAETRRVLKRSPETANLPEEEIDSRLYKVWKQGSLWGSVDTSGDWEPEEDDDSWDTTSLMHSVAGSTFGDDNDDDERNAWVDEDSYNSSSNSNSHSYKNGNNDNDDDDALSDGQRTPTQRSPRRGTARATTGGTYSSPSSRESTPLVDQPFAMTDLARLLHPATTEERNEAHALAAHLASDRIVTRSQYARMQRGQRARVLLPPNKLNPNNIGSRLGGGRFPHHYHQHPNNNNGNSQNSGSSISNNSSNSSNNRKPLAPEEEAELLEQLIIERRTLSAHRHVDSNSRKSNDAHGGGEEEHGGGPLCVVCHSASRTIIVWPCRCLSLCDECRVTLAMNNFDKCVCCRREVISFSRIYVP